MPRADWRRVGQICWRAALLSLRLRHPNMSRVCPMRKFPMLVTLLVVTAPAAAATPNVSPEGYWRTAGGNGIIEIARCGADDTLCGKLAWFHIDSDDPDQQGLDLKNPDPAERNRSLCGITFMYGFKPTAPDHWDGGMVYDADSGNTYHAMMTLRPDGKLDLHGYIGISLFGRSEIWTRFAPPLPSCPGH
jgi:uncharacterized protein (DUF2147 family)